MPTDGTPGVPMRPRLRAWVWLAVPCVTLAVVVPWLIGIDARGFGWAEISLPASSVSVVEDGVGFVNSVSGEDGAGATIAGAVRSQQPASVQVVVEPVMPTAQPAGAAQRVETRASREPAGARRSRTMVTPLPGGPPSIEIDLSLVKVRYLDGGLAPTVIRGLAPTLPAIRSCITPIVQRQPELRGTVTTTISAREGRISAVDVKSDIRHTRLRFCFRQALMGRSVPEEPSFDARVEFFVLPRVIR